MHSVSNALKTQVSGRNRKTDVIKGVFSIKQRGFYDWLYANDLIVGIFMLIKFDRRIHLLTAAAAK